MSNGSYGPEPLAENESETTRQAMADYLEVVGHLVNRRISESQVERQLDRILKADAPGGDSKYCAMLALDVASFTQRRDTNRTELRAALYRLLEDACDTAGLPRGDCRVEDRGDGLLLVAPPSVSAMALVDQVIPQIRSALRRRNTTADPAAELRLRIAGHVGYVPFDLRGGIDLHAGQLFRLLDAPRVGEELAANSGDCVVVVSDHLYQEVMRNNSRFDSAAFRPIVTAAEEAADRGWFWLSPEDRAVAVGSVSTVDFIGNSARSLERLKVTNVGGAGGVFETFGSLPLQVSASQLTETRLLQRGGTPVLRILLGARLRRLRTQRRITCQEAGDAIRASQAKVARMERGRVPFRRRDLADLLSLYGVNDGERDEILALAERANEPGWWLRYSDALPAWADVYFGLEEAASRIWTYEMHFVPGLLQTDAYARAVMALGHSGAPEHEVERRVGLRMRRQMLLTADDALHLWAVIDEAALRRPLGGVHTMREQLHHLVEMAELPNVTLQVVPFHLGGYAAAGRPFTILRFAERDLPDVVYLEQLTSALYLDKREDVDHYRAVMDRLCSDARWATDVRDVLNQIRRDL